MFVGSPKEVYSKIKSRIKKLIDEERVIQFALGKTTNPKKLKASTDADKISPLYETDNLKEIIKLLDKLIVYFNEFDHYYEIKNEFFDEAMGSYYLYIALWY